MNFGRNKNFVIRLGLLGLLLTFGMWGGGLFMSSPARAATGTNHQINFQGKVVNKTDGTNVASGTYSFTFSLYTVESDGTSIWTETKDLSVTDGIFQTDLGDTTAIPGSVDFNTDNIYLGVVFNGDVEMSPRVRFTAVPQAFNAEKVAGLTVTDTTGTLTIPDGKTISFGGAFSTTAGNDVALTTTGTTALTLPTSGTLLSDTASSEQSIASTQASGSVFGITDSTNITGAATGLSVTLSGTGAYDQTGLEFNLSGATGTNLNDILGSGSTWKISRTGAATLASITSGGTITFSGLSTAGIVTNTVGGVLGTTSSLGTALGGTGTTTTFTQGSLVFAGASGVYGQDNANLYWNGTEHRLGIGNTSPTSALSVGSSSQFQVDSSGAIVAATGISSSGTVHFSGLSASSLVATDSSKNLVSLADGTSGQCLLSQGTGVAPAWGSCGISAIGSTVGSATQGSIFFTGTSGTLAQDNAQLFWDATDNRLGLGTDTPAAKLDVVNTTEQLRLGYDATHYSSLIVGATGNLDISPTGGKTTFTGSVGIGAAPSGGYALDVAGDVNATSISIAGVRLTTPFTTSVAPNTTWIAKDSSRAWQAVAMSADGTKQTAVDNGGYIYVSTNSGTTWTPEAADTTRSWYSIAMSADGTKQTAAVSSGSIYVSTAAVFMHQTDNTSDVGLGTDTPAAKLDVVSTTEQLRLGYDATKYSSFTVGSTGDLTIASTGGNTLFSDNVGIGTTSPTAQLHTTGTVRFANFGSGTLQTDSSGNVSVSSDERLKTIAGNYTRGVEALMNITPIQYRWNGSSGMETQDTYTGFSAQNVQISIPEAVGMDSRGYLTLSDRPILATLVNAVKEQQGVLSKQGTDIQNLLLKTDADATTVSTLRNSVDANLVTISATLATLDMDTSALKTDIRTISDADTTLAATVAVQGTTLAGHTADLTVMKTQFGTMQTELQTLMDFYGSLQLGNMVTKDTLGDVDLGKGTLFATEIQTGKLTINNGSTKDAPSIGSSLLYPVAVDADGDGKDDYSDLPMSDPAVAARDGRVATVPTKAVTSKSHIFVTPRVALPEPLAVTTIADGKSFTVSLKTPVAVPIVFDWWIVEEK